MLFVRSQSYEETHFSNWTTGHKQVLAILGFHFYACKDDYNHERM